MAANPKQQPGIPDGGYGWLVCLIASTVQMGIGGAEYGFGVILGPYAQHFKSSLSVISMGGELLLVMQFLLGPLYSRYMSAGFFMCAPLP